MISILKKEGPPKYYAQMVPTDKKDLKSLSEDVSRHTTMSAADVYGVLMALEEEIIAALKGGAIQQSDSHGYDPNPPKDRDTH